MNTVGGTDRYDYDANGNVKLRNKGLGSQQTLGWDVENHLLSIAATGLVESYDYNEHGIRIRKESNGATTLYLFAHYEVENGVIVKYYFFGGQRVAMKRGTGAITYLHGDHLSSTALSTTNSGAFDVGQGYRGYGNYRTGGSLPTDHRYTGQKLDIATGLMYYNARYYDRTVGHFISPDTLVPDPTSVWDYNRFMYVRGNPLKYNDPTGHTCLANTGGSWDCPQSPGIGGSTQTLDIGSGLTVDPATYVDQTWNQPTKSDVSKVIDTILPDSGAAAVGLTGSIGIGVDVVGDIGLVYVDGQGNVQLFGGSLGIGGNTGANIDMSVFVNVMPTASTVDVYAGKTVNAGISAGEGLGGGIEINVTKDPTTDRPTAGLSVMAGTTAKVSVPIPPVEFYGNVTHTWHSPFRFNIYEAFGLPSPQRE